MRDCMVYNEPSEPPTVAVAVAAAALLSFHEPTVSHKMHCLNIVAAAIAPVSHLKIALVMNSEKHKTAKL